MIVLITGGSGFIGRNLIEQLNGNYDILAPTHQELELLDEGAVKNYLNQNKADVVIHSAMKLGHRNAKDLSNLVYTNIRMFFNLIRNAHCFGKMIYLSTGAVYDERYYLPKMKEEYFDTQVPIDGTGFPKYICSKYVEKVDNVIELRPFGVFGKYEDWHIRFISNAICKTLYDLPITIKQNRKFDYVYIDDLVKIIHYFIENRSQYQVYNVTPNEAIELFTLAERVLDISKKSLEIKIAKPGMGVEYSGDNGRLKKEIPTFLFTKIEEAIQKLYSWYLSNREHIYYTELLIDK
jgi:UDP-glucose 4-epimerase